MNIHQQHDGLREYLNGCGLDDPRTLVQGWAKMQWYERLVPVGATVPERALFISDFEIVLTLTLNDLQPGHENPQFPLNTAEAKVSIVDEAGRRLLLARVAAKEHMARLCEKGKIPTNQYLRKVNELRAAEQLPPLSPSEVYSTLPKIKSARSKRKL